MPELRKDPTVGRWVIIATERVRRPSDFVLPRVERRGGPCALCAGRERETPPEVLAYRADAHAAPDTPGWRVRVVPNKFPALRIEGPLERRGHGLYDVMNGVGAHEVIVESPAHDASLAHLAPDAVEEVLVAYRDRIVDLKRDERFRSVLVFKNHGPQAGASLEHPHSQLIATPIVPLVVADELRSARTYHDYRERCLFCDILQQESDEENRVVAESEHVVAIVPFAARTPFETWLLPRRHLASYEHVTAGERRDLARILCTVLQRIHGLVGEAPVGFVLHSAPFGEGDVSFFHWHWELTPAVAIPDFQPEGSGFPVNPLPPEDAARLLRGTRE
jgi:UDPglucose--hexose-1-phosphate uridylyltransferase